MTKPILALEGVNYTYPGRDTAALTDVSFTVNKGEWVALVGQNGSGKSTLAKLLIGLDFPAAGTIRVNDILLEEDSVWTIRRLIGLVFQNPDNQFVGTTVEDDVAFGLENAGVPRVEMIQRVQDAVAAVKMTDFLRQEPHHLSGGQKQRVAIASVLALQPEVIVFDEATSMLDPLGKAEILEIIRTLKEDKQLTIVSITHDLEEAAQADRVIVLNQGRVFADEVPAQLFQPDRGLEKVGLLLPFHVQMAQALREHGVPEDKLVMQ